MAIKCAHQFKDFLFTFGSLPSHTFFAKAFICIFAMNFDVLSLILSELSNTSGMNEQDDNFLAQTSLNLLSSNGTRVSVDISRMIDTGAIDSIIYVDGIDEYQSLKAVSQKDDITVLSYFIDLSVSLGSITIGTPWITVENSCFSPLAEIVSYMEGTSQSRVKRGLPVPTWVVPESVIFKFNQRVRVPTQIDSETGRMACVNRSTLLPSYSLRWAITGDAAYAVVHGQLYRMISSGGTVKPQLETAVDIPNVLCCCYSAV